jgi:hypothetical protein
MKKYEGLDDSVKWFYNKILDENRTTSKLVLINRFLPFFPNFKGIWVSSFAYDPKNEVLSMYVKNIDPDIEGVKKKVYYEELMINNKKKKLKCVTTIGLKCIRFKKIDENKTQIVFLNSNINSLYFSWNWSKKSKFECFSL